MANLTIKEYTEKLAKELETRISDVQISLNEVNKNGVVLHAITIRPNGANIGVNLYTNKFYEDEADVEVAAREMTEIYKHNKPNDKMFDVNGLSNYEQTKERLRLRLVNTEKNAGCGFALKPIEGMETLSVMPFILIDRKEDGLATAKISENLLDVWGVDIDEVISQATLNQIDEGASIAKMADAIKEMMNGDMPEDLFECILPFFPPMFVVSNKDRMSGAIEVILHSNEVAKELGGDFIMIPSSVHEVICLPYTPNLNPEEIKEMVKEVNATEVKPEDYLSGNVYAYVNGAFTTVA